jgi:hypothetical protein
MTFSKSDTSISVKRVSRGTVVDDTALDEPMVFVRIRFISKKYSDGTIASRRLADLIAGPH